MKKTQKNPDYGPTLNAGGISLLPPLLDDMLDTDQDMFDIVIYLENISDDPKIEGSNKEQIDMVDANTVTHDENGK